MVTGRMASPGNGEIVFQLLALLGLYPDSECDLGPIEDQKGEPESSDVDANHIH